jgi:uncharacterized cupredoxin-like copper-binding protein
MFRLLNLVALLVAIGAASSALAGSKRAGNGRDQSGHRHEMESFSAGQPGDAKRPARVIQVIMLDGDGKMSFVPDRIDVRQGEQIRFMLRNDGELEHEFVLANHVENLGHAATMKINPDMVHDAANAKRLQPKGTAETLWRFTKTGEFEFACLIPGHSESGMIGIVTVE